MGVADEIQKLQSLRDSGALTEDEFSAAKARLLFGAQDDKPSAPGGSFTANDASVWAMYMHFSQLLGYVIPVVGFLTPIIIWQVKKHEFPQLDAHGKNVVNWLISMTIYAVGAGVMSVFLIGIPVLLALAVASIAFPIIAGIKANNGEVWRYPLALTLVR
jgi:uncharacterized Tic20 family protein